MLERPPFNILLPMDKYQETFDTWNKLAQLYEDKFMGLDLYNDTYDSFLEWLPPDADSILEVGCGPGMITKYLLTKKPGLKIKGIDVSENMVDLARKNNPTAAFEQMDCRALGQLTTRFDGIICGFCIPYLSKEDCLDLLSNSHRLLQENGLLYLSFVEGDYEKSGFMAGSSGDRTYFYYHGLDFIENGLTFYNFKIKETINKVYHRAAGVQEIHTVVIAEKM